MATRVEESTFRVRSRPARDRAAVAAAETRGTRMLFLFAIFVFGLASIYTSVALLARITPALFPGQSIVDIPVVRDIHKITRAPTSDDSVFNRPINVVIIGLDKRPDWRFEGPYLNDTVMVATLNPQTKSANILSFPRDLYVFSGEDRDKFAHSYGKGWQEGESFDAAAGRVSADLEQSFGIKVDYYVVMDFKGVEGLVNALGGIEVDIPYELSVDEWYYSDDDVHAQWISFPSGINQLDGYHAVAFGRHREYDNDLKRVKRQQLVMTAALAKAFSMNLLNDPKGVWDAYHDTVKTDMGLTTAVRYAPLLRDAQGRINTYSLGDEVNGRQTLFGMDGGFAGAVLEWDPQNVEYILSQVFSSTNYPSADVEIQNGYAAGAEGEARARSLGVYLQYSKRLPTVYLGPQAAPQPNTTITVYGGNRALAEDIAEWMNLPQSVIREEERPEDSPLPDVLITIGRDFEIPE
ncbi:MAG: LCP family protein [Dehalococcoidia bacterium]